MKFVVEITLPEYFKAETEESIRVHLKRTIKASTAFAACEVGVELHPYDKPQDLRTELPLPEHDPMDLVKEIGPYPGHNGPRTTYVWFNNGSSACACHETSALNNRIPSLR